MDVDQLSSDDSSISTDVDMVDVDSVHSFIPMVATKIRDRFKESRLQFDSRVSDHDISTLFPVEYNKSDSLHERIQRLMSCTLDVPDSELEQLLAIHQATHDRPSIYIRSWTISADTLAALLANLALHSSSHPLLRIWRQYQQGNPDKAIHIRYVGSTIRSVNTRHVQDSRNQSAFLGRFLTALQGVDIEAYNHARLYEFSRMKNDTDGKVDRRDMLEQIAITFFGLENLLNTQIGGVSFTYDPGMSAFKDFQKYNLSFFKAMNDNIDIHQNEFSEKLTTWLNVITQEGERIAREHNNQNSIISPALRTMILQQALPKVVGGHVVLIVVGAEISHGSFKTATPFFVNSRSGEVTKTLLCRQAAWSSGQENFSLDRFQPDLFPFIDLYPWLDTINTKKAALRQLYGYLSTTEPLVVASLGKHPTSALFSNLLHHHGCGHRSEGFSYISTIALPRICYFVDDQWVEASEADDPPVDNAFITIGNLHPGYERYGERSIDLIELMDITWTVTLLVSEIVLGVVLANPGLSRSVIIQRVWPFIDPMSPHADERLLGAYFQAERIKKDYQAFYRAKIQEQPKSARNVDHDILSIAACARMAAYGFAEGAPNSDARKKQVQRMWRRNLPPLHMHISRDNKDQWFQWANTLKEGISFFASAERHVGMATHHPLWNCLRPYIPSDTKADWLDDEANLTAACLAWGAAMKLYLPDDHFSSDNQKRRIALRWGDDDENLYAYMAVNHMRLVTLSLTHPLLIRWRDGDKNVDVALRFKAKRQNQFDTRERYHVAFNKDGISLKPVDQHDDDIFHIPLDAVYGDPLVKKLWIHEMHQQGYKDIDQDPVSHIGIPAFTAVTKPINRQKTIQPMDALWLLQQFVNEQTINFHLASSDFIGIIPSDFVSFQQIFINFLNNNYRQHPYNRWWYEKVNDLNIKKESKNIAANLLHLYPSSIKGNFRTFKKRHAKDHSNQKQCITIQIKR
ncbi:hypothetical protein O0I10_007125 [Lichtheimia ornata]|uniref:Uncharacterized protein n=1 Tax=Lichtheimia ornata TaxID=688661 RepID=A0AAD7XY69_9FUNG|nr:uncharacterized protein O0I10_007125 [Lichtheimia ornata]KAJ8657308.1 hypothetical protein O0I10_007125 [Lichtheimia ornata]